MPMQQMFLGLGGPAEFSDATGGTVSTPGDGYKYHLFTSPGTFTVNGGPIPAPNNNVLAVGGGGGGGGRHGGGGGGGGYINTGPGPGAVSAVEIPKGAHSVTIGQGGNGSRPNYEPNIQNNTDQGCQGGDTSIGSVFVAAGGGWGGDYDMNSGNPGGCGGGAGNGPMGSVSGPTAVNPYTPTSLNPGYGPGNGGGVGEQYGPTSPLHPAAAPDQGSNGGNLDGGSSGWVACGGGGAGSQGAAATPDNRGGPGGNGRQCPWAFPTMGAPGTSGQPGTTTGQWFGGGGGGGGPTSGGSGDSGTGGKGGGGNGAYPDDAAGNAGTDGAGAGGGGTRNAGGGSEPGGPGGNGVVLIRYPTTPW